MAFERITTDPRQMGGVPCLRGLRIPVATIVALVAEGLTTAQIAARLYVSPHTVITHVKHVFTKLGVSRRAELARLVAVAELVGRR